jgi:hypothetical protein
MRRAILWSAAIAAAAVLLVATGYRSRDPDSALYAQLSAALAQQPMSRWIAPEWGGAWDHQGLFREHPVGILVPPALLIRAGFPPEQAAYVVNMVYQVAALVLIPAVAAVAVSGVEARSLAWILQLLPVAFVYRIRGNQEPPLLVCFLLMLYATHRSRTQPWWIVLTVVAFCTLTLIKGAFAVPALLGAVVWAAIVVKPGDSTRSPWPWVGLAASLASAAAVVALYELVYARVTGDSFLDFYRSTRLGASIRLTDAALVPHVLANAGWYVTRLLWFAAPWSIVAVIAIWTWMRPGAGGLRRIDDLAARVLVWVLLLAAMYIAALSPANVRAERFIFPLYFVVASVGAVAAMRVSPVVRQIVVSADRPAWLPCAVWFATFLLSLGSRVLR